MTVTVTKPGLYKMAEADYHADPVPGGSLSCSGAKVIIPPGCPAIYRYERDHPPAPSEAMELGTAAHREVLGVGADYAVWPGASWNEAGGAAFKREARAAGRIPIKAEQHHQIKAMAAAIEAHPSARLLLRAEEVLPEISLFWQDDLDGMLETPIWRRARMDAVRLPGQLLITDYKTTVSASPGEFARQAGNLRYWMQDPWYRRAVTHTLGDADPLFLFVAQDKRPPYPVLIADLPFAAIQAGEAANLAACLAFAQCQATGEWPGHQDPAQHVITLDVPPWCFR